MEKVTMQFILTLLGVDFPKDRSQIEIPCPKCGRSMGLSFVKESCNCFHSGCGFHAGKIDLYAFCRNLSHEAAVQELSDIQKDKTWTKCFTYPQVKELEKSFPKLVDLAPMAVRHHTYTEMLKILHLSDMHRKNLVNRGVFQETIDQKQYRDTPCYKTECARIVKQLLALGCVLDGVPGFYKDDAGYHLVTCPAGMFFPVRGTGSENRIQSLQIRLDTVPANGRKFRTLSSSRYTGGAASSTFLHFAGTGCPDKELYLTEGPLKADIANQFTGKSFLALTGVNSVQFLGFHLKALKKRYDLQIIRIALDMDYQVNPDVYAALLNICKICQEGGFEVIIVNWDPTYKGIDDFTYHKYLLKQQIA